MAKEIMRSIRLTPYRAGCGPEFRLVIWDCDRQTRPGAPQSAVGYRFSEILANGKRRTLFEGEDYGCSPMHAIDSNECIADLLGFLTLRRGDTDASYFEGYTERQNEFSSHHAEAVSCCDARFENR